MSNFMLAVAEGDFRFDFEELVPKILDVWPGARFFPAEDREATVSKGELQFVDPTGSVGLIVGLLPGCQGMDIDGPVHDAAAFVAWLTTQPWYPTDALIMLIGETSQPQALRPGMEPEEIIQAHPA